jgi:hypothetical protein
MDLSKIPLTSDGSFPLLDLQAKVESETHSSVSLIVGRVVDRPSDCPPDSDWFFESLAPGGFFEHVGWIDIHYPCKGHREALIRMSIPNEYHKHDRIEAMVAALFRAFSIPSDTVFVACYFSCENTFCILPNDQFGMQRNEMGSLLL